MTKHKWKNEDRRRVCSECGVVSASDGQSPAAYEWPDGLKTTEEGVCPRIVLTHHQTVVGAPAVKPEEVPPEVITAGAVSMWMAMLRTDPFKVPDVEYVRLVCANILTAAGWERK
jgi:hypothetical protein